ncbi:MAG: NTP transferase domain-containing protein [Sedimentisphaerales bacterium]|nr:NTP transferase domain-containing protein [Sedimentisphaerales bacterium]
MLRLDGMLMIGSAGPNVGKTKLACAILRRFAGKHGIVGLKVTAIKEKNGQCPRGGAGCGVCSSLEGVFCITEEKNSVAGKDTSRLLAAGAERVFWLRALKSHLAEGLAALLDVVGPDAVSICESNSLRQVVEPGSFLMVRGTNTKGWKDSARKVKRYADRIVVSDGKKFDLHLNRIELIEGKWRLMEESEGDNTDAASEATAIIMAGGGSGRMGTDKRLLQIDGRPIIENIRDQLCGRFKRVIISANDPEKVLFLGLEVVPDRIPRQGPLMGIASALEASRSELNFVVACDIPHIDIRLVEQMLAEAESSEADVVIPITSGGRYEPLFAVYRRSVLEAANSVLASGKRKISDIFGLCQVNYITLGDPDTPANLNTQAEYEEFTRQHKIEHLSEEPGQK